MKIRPVFDFSEKEAWDNSRCMTTARPLFSLCEGKEGSNRICI